jgi:hypothetical protein
MRLSIFPDKAASTLYPALTALNDMSIAYPGIPFCLTDAGVKM